MHIPILAHTDVVRHIDEGDLSQLSQPRAMASSARRWARAKGSAFSSADTASARGGRFMMARSSEEFDALTAAYDADRLARVPALNSTCWQGSK
jgi:hypothetical protein